MTVHALSLWLSCAAFAVAFVFGWVFLMQERQLKHKRMGWWFHQLPALGTIDRINYLSLGLGFAALSFGVLLGWWKARTGSPDWWSHDPQVVLTMAVWGLYLFLWFVRFRLALRGRKVAWLSIGAFSLVVAAFLGLHHHLPVGAA